MLETTDVGLQERQGTPLTLTVSEESFNSTNQNTPNHREDSKPDVHVQSGYNSVSINRNGARMSGHNVFVIGVMETIDSDYKCQSKETN